jgi:hypothetical protein
MSAPVAFEAAERREDRFAPGGRSATPTGEQYEPGSPCSRRCPHPDGPDGQTTQNCRVSTVRERDGAWTPDRLPWRGSADRLYRGDPGEQWTGATEGARPQGDRRRRGRRSTGRGGPLGAPRRRVRRRSRRRDGVTRRERWFGGFRQSRIGDRPRPDRRCSRMRSTVAASSLRRSERNGRRTGNRLAFSSRSDSSS